MHLLPDFVADFLCFCCLTVGGALAETCFFSFFSIVITFTWKISATLKVKRYKTNILVLFPATLNERNRPGGIGTVSNLDQNWCYKSLGCFATQRRDLAFESLSESNPRQALQVGLDFVLGRGQVLKVVRSSTKFRWSSHAASPSGSSVKTHENRLVT